MLRYLKVVLTLIVCVTFAVSAESQAIVDSFPSPGNEPRGLAWDGEYLWCADAEAGFVYKLDPSNGTIVSSFPFAIGSNYGGITWSDDNNMWIGNGSYVYKVDPITGQQLYSFHCPGG